MVSKFIVFAFALYLVLASPFLCATKLYIVPSHIDLNLKYICHPVRSRIRDNKFNYIIFVVRFEQFLCSYQSTQLQYSLNRMQYCRQYTNIQYQRKRDVGKKTQKYFLFFMDEKVGMFNVQCSSFNMESDIFVALCFSNEFCYIFQIEFTIIIML